MIGAGTEFRHFCIGPSCAWIWRFGCQCSVGDESSYISEEPTLVASDERKSSCFTKSYDGSKALGLEGFLTSGQRSRRNQRFGARPNVPTSFNRIMVAGC